MWFRFGSVEVVQDLLAASPRSARPDVRAFHDGFSALHVAAMKGHAEVVQALLAAGADVDQRDECYGFTPLHLAAMEGNVDIVQMLLASGADPYKRDGEGNIAYDLAFLNRHLDVEEALLDGGRMWRHMGLCMLGVLCCGWRGLRHPIGSRSRPGDKTNNV